MHKIIIDKLKSWWGIVQTLAGAFVISAGWNFYHTKHKPYDRFFIFVISTWLVVFVGYRLFRWLYHFLTAKFNRHIFWQKEFGRFLDSLFFLSSLFFLVFFCRNQLFSVFIFLGLMGLFFYKTQVYLSHHPSGHEWKIVNKNVFTLIFFLFGLFSIFQYLAYRFANFDAYLKFYNIVLFRSWAMTMFWVLGFVVSTLIFWKIRSPWRYFAIALWGISVVLLVCIWGVNIGIMYFTGLYLSPLMLGVADGAVGVASGPLTILVGASIIVILAIFGYIFRKIIHTYHGSSFRQWAYYSLALVAVSLFSLFGLSSFKNTPEFTVAKNFYNFFLGTKTEAKLSPVIKEKMERFGLIYNTDDFHLAHKEQAFTSGARLLSDNLIANKPNVIIIFFESFSSRLTSVYNKNVVDLTPGLEQMASDRHTTVFKKFYNASTPTINGIISQLCSFLPPTGYTEVEDNKNLQRLRLLCLPTILKDNGYKSATYITAVDKEFENKNSIFTSMDTDGIYGQDELKNIIKGEPLSWGYSDHQLYPAMWRLIEQKKQEPFLMMLSTVDTHAPFDLAQDMVMYREGDSNVLNSYRTADDAFAKFWKEFRQSKYYSNTIVVAVADHAVFPGADIKKLFPSDANKLSFYDETMFMMYVPQGKLPKEVDMYSSSMDVAPTLLQVLNINTPNSFEGHSIFDDRSKYQNVLGMHEYGLYINQEWNEDRRDISYEMPSELKCDEEVASLATSSPLTLCEYLEFYKWKRQMFEQGRFWGK